MTMQYEYSSATYNHQWPWAEVLACGHNRDLEDFASAPHISHNNHSLDDSPLLQVVISS